MKRTPWSNCSVIDSSWVSSQFADTVPRAASWGAKSVQAEPCWVSKDWGSRLNVPALWAPGRARPEIGRVPKAGSTLIRHPIQLAGCAVTHRETSVVEGRAAAGTEEEPLAFEDPHAVIRSAPRTSAPSATCVDGRRRRVIGWRLAPGSQPPILTDQTRPVVDSRWSLREGTVVVPNGSRRVGPGAPTSPGRQG